MESQTLRDITSNCTDFLWVDAIGVVARLVFVGP